MANVKYIRVSTQHQNTARQETDSAQYDRVYIEKASGKNADRPQLQAMLDWVREGDTVTVESYSRLARSTRDLLDIIQKLDDKHVAFISQKERIDTSTPQGRLMMTIFAGLSQFERECLLERQAEGIAIAKAEGRMGRPKVECDDFESIAQRWQAGELRGVDAMREAHMTKATFYRRLKEMGISKPQAEAQQGEA